MASILLVEDEEDLINIVGTILADEGYDVRKALCAESALELCGSYRPDLILCDVKMGKMDGFSLLEKLKASERLREIPFIFVSSFDQADARRRGLKLGAYAYITKPFDIDELMVMVRKLVPPA